jgi:uncharacterized protein (TIGR02270 family)
MLGDPAVVPKLIERMKQPELARLAGEAFSTITGVHISYDKLEGAPPAGFNAGPTEDPADANVEMDADEDLAWPDSALVANWWKANQARFTPGTRYLLGKPIEPVWLAEVLRTGRQRQRATAALELALRDPGAPLFEVRAPGRYQLRLLAGRT